MSTQIPKQFPVKYQCVGGAVVSITPRPPRAFGRAFSVACSGCGLHHVEETDSHIRNWGRVRTQRVSDDQIAHFEGLAWNVATALANTHASQCRRIP